MTQGDPLACPRFCLAWHKSVRKLGARLRATGGHAVFGMDDGYGVGPSEVVFPAMEDFIREVEEEVGLVCQRAKSKVFSWEGILPGAPEGFTLAGIKEGEVFLPAMLVYGVPVGVDLYVTKMLDTKVGEIEENAKKGM